MGCYVLLVLVIIFLRWHLSHQNSKKDRLADASVGHVGDEGMVHAFEDLTDRENQNFRYVY
jgi:hypothetical protein